MTRIAKYVSLVKFEHTLFALPFSLAGFSLALTRGNASFSWTALVFVLMCMVSARNAAMAFNRWADRDIDLINPRTRKRDLPAGKISSTSAFCFVLLNVLIFIFSAWMLNPLCFYLSPLALFVILGYSYTKRFTPLSHFVLGLGLAIAPTGAYLALTGAFDLLPVLLSFLVLCWTGGFDIIYSLQDEAFDKENKLFSLPSWLGVRRALMISSGVHILSIILAVILGLAGKFGILYWLGTAGFCGMLIWQHLIVKPDDLSRVEEAFFNGNSVAAALFSCFMMADLFAEKYFF